MPEEAVAEKVDGEQSGQPSLSETKVMVSLAGRKAFGPTKNKDRAPEEHPTRCRADEAAVTQ